MLDEDLSSLLGGRGDRRAAVARRAISRRAARRRRARLGRLSGVVETGQPIDGLDAAAAVPGALVFHAGTAGATAARDRRRPRADRGRPRADTTRRDRHGLSTRRRASASTGCSIRRDIGRKALQRPVKYSVVTFGCRVNQADSLAIEGDACARAAPSTRRPQDADLVVVNTCSVTATADQGARQTIRRVARDNPGARDRRDRLLRDASPGRGRASLPNVLHVVSNDDKDDLRRALATRTETASRCDHGRALWRRRRTVRRAARAGRRRPDGVHAARADRLRRALQLLHHPDDARHGPQRGRWTTWCGDRARRRRRLQGDRDHRRAPRLVRPRSRDGSRSQRSCACSRSGTADVLFRISSLEPMDCTAEIVDLSSPSPRLAPHFHLPLQHGVRRMLRPCAGRTPRVLCDAGRSSFARGCRTRRSGRT